jgi:flavin reductase (DIM6/NTAB) family NADH-FMN oxidoreductase RutF
MQSVFRIGAAGESRVGSRPRIRVDSRTAVGIGAKGSSSAGGRPFDERPPRSCCRASRTARRRSAVAGGSRRHKIAAMRHYAKRRFPVDDVRRFLEPGPIVLVSSAWKGKTNVMTLGWHMILGQAPSLVGCFIWDRNHSFEMIRRSKACVINIPTADLATTVVGIGNSTGREIDKFAEYGLTAVRADTVRAPLIAECYASFECRLADASLIDAYSLFVFKVVKAHVATSPKFPKTLHYRGGGLFMIAGPTVKTYRRYFKPECL